MYIYIYVNVNLSNQDFQVMKNRILFFQTELRLETNQLEKCIYNPNSVYFNKIQKLIYLCSRRKAVLHREKIVLHRESRLTQRKPSYTKRKPSYTDKKASYTKRKPSYTDR